MKQYEPYIQNDNNNNNNIIIILKWKKKNQSKGGKDGVGRRERWREGFILFFSFFSFL